MKYFSQLTLRWYSFLFVTVSVAAAPFWTYIEPLEIVVGMNGLKHKYVVGKVIGDGEDGIIRLGWDLDSKIHVAIKFGKKKEHVQKDKDFYFNSKNSSAFGIPDWYDDVEWNSKTAKGYTYGLVIKLLGEPIDNLLDEPFSPNTTAEIGCQVVKSLEHIHLNLKWTHGDIHGQNLITGLPSENEDGLVFVADYGRAVDEGNKPKSVEPISNEVIPIKLDFKALGSTLIHCLKPDTKLYPMNVHPYTFDQYTQECSSDFPGAEMLRDYFNKLKEFDLGTQSPALLYTELYNILSRYKTGVPLTWRWKSRDYLHVANDRKQEVVFKNVILRNKESDPSAKLVEFDIAQAEGAVPADFWNSDPKTYTVSIHSHQKPPPGKKDVEPYAIPKVTDSFDWFKLANPEFVEGSNGEPKKFKFSDILAPEKVYLHFVDKIIRETLYDVNLWIRPDRHRMEVRTAELKEYYEEDEIEHLTDFGNRFRKASISDRTEEKDGFKTIAVGAKTKQISNNDSVITFEFEFV